MPAQQVDLVLVLDASRSMKPCFAALCKHLEAVLIPLQGHITKVNFGLLAMNVGKHGEGHVVRSYFLGGDTEIFDDLYQSPVGAPISRQSFFTTDAADVVARLEEIKPEGDEEMLIALDIAADFPFGPLASTKRVIALFSDEQFETGALGKGTAETLPQLMEKLQARHIQLFAAIPEGRSAEQLAAVDRSEIEFVESGGGLSSVDFGQLLRQMGKSISVSVLQATGEERYQRGLFGQEDWGSGAGGDFTADRTGPGQ